MSKTVNRRVPRGFSLDRATSYALGVVSGKVVAGPHVRGTCDRHLKDLETRHGKDLRYDRGLAKDAIDFFEEVLRLNGGEYEGAAFKLLPWQAFIIGCLFGWLLADGLRRFRWAYIETGKGSGKSPLAAGIGIKLLCADDEPRAEIYAAATKKDQARVLFRDAVAMVEQSPELACRLSMSGGTDKHNIAYMTTGSFFRPISSEERGVGQSGPRPHGALLDEVHEHPTNAMVEFLRAGTKNRRQALIAMITNSGSSRQSPCFEYHEYGRKIAGGEVYDDGFFSYICAMDEGDDPFVDEACWMKANPSLPAIPGLKYLREQVREAKGMPSKEALVRRLNFCEWTDAENPLFSRDVWEACLHPLSLPEYTGRKCYAAIDLSGKADLTAMAYAFPCDDGTLDVFCEYWTPLDTLAEREVRDRAPYTRWHREGFLHATPGKSIDYSWVATRIGDCREAYELLGLGFDRTRIEDLERELEEIGVEHRREDDQYGYGLLMIPHGQGFVDMGKAIDAFETRVLNGTIRIHRNPVTTMCASNAIVDTDPAENRKFNKRKATGRIDGMVAIAMVVRIADAAADQPTNIYDYVELA